MISRPTDASRGLACRSVGRATTAAVVSVLLALALGASACTKTTDAATRGDGDVPSTAATAPAGLDPSRRGSFGVSYAEVGVIDPFRVRRLPLSIWYPTTDTDVQPAHYDILPTLTLPAIRVADRAAVASGKHPVVIFSHGSGASRLTYWYLTEMLASHGFVVIAPDHVGNTFADLADVEGFVRTADERPRDVHFILDQLVEADRGGNNATGPELGDLLRGHVDVDHIGIAGHSYGGYTALATAGGTANGDEPDPRVKAVAALEPLSDKLSDDNLRQVDVPTLLMGGTLDFTTPIEPMVNRPYDLMPTKVKYRADIIGANHESFTILHATDTLLDDPSVPDDVRAAARRTFPGTSGPEVMAPDEAEAIIVRYVVSFFATQLSGDDRYAAFLSPSPHVDFRTN